MSLALKEEGLAIGGAGAESRGQIGPEPEIAASPAAARSAAAESVLAPGSATGLRTYDLRRGSITEWRNVGGAGGARPSPR